MKRNRTLSLRQFLDRIVYTFWGIVFKVYILLKGFAMLRQFLFAKIHRAVVTAKDVNYNGSITIDTQLLAETGIQVWERVQVVDVNNGARFETYVIPGEAGKGEIQLNGAAAHLVELGDRVIIMAYAQFNAAEMLDHHPIVVIVNEHNQIVEKRLE